MNMIKHVLRTTAIVAVLTLTPQAYAAGDAQEPAAETTAAPSPKAAGCKRAEAVKMADGKAGCIALAPGLLADDVLYEQGKQLATEGEYDWALELLTLITKQDDAKVLNYVGYSHRKAGRLETGIEVYKKALALDPNYVQAREYLGEAYILAGKKELAQAELAEIKTRCGADCAEFKELEKALAAN